MVHSIIFKAGLYTLFCFLLKNYFFLHLQKILTACLSTFSSLFVSSTKLNIFNLRYFNLRQIKQNLSIEFVDKLFEVRNDISVPFSFPSPQGRTHSQLWHTSPSDGWGLQLMKQECLFKSYGMSHMPCPKSKGLGLHLFPNVMEEQCNSSKLAKGWVLFKAFLVCHFIGE